MTSSPTSQDLVLYVTRVVLDRLEAWRAGDQRRIAELDLQVPKDETTFAALWSAAFGIAERTLNVLDAREAGSAADLLSDFRGQLAAASNRTQMSKDPIRAMELAGSHRESGVFERSLGITTAASEEHLRRQLSVVGVINFLADELLGDSERMTRPNTELARLAAKNRDVPVDLTTSVRSGLTTARLALNEIGLVLSQRLAVPPLLLQILTRAALLGGGRVVFALGSEDSDERHRNVRTVLQQEAQSYSRGLNAMADFERLSGLRPSDSYLHTRRQEIQTLLASNPTPTGETRLLNEMAAGIGRRLAARGEAEGTSETLGEQIAFIWNVYSGVAHGFGWPTVYARDLAPADFLADFAIVVSVVHFAFDDTLRLTAAST